MPVLMNPRSSGSFTSAQRHKPHTEATLTPSPCTKNSTIQHATADQLAHIMRTTAMRQPRQATMHLKCTPPLNSMASRLHRLYQATQVVSWVSSHNLASDKVQGLRHQPTKHQPLQHHWAGLGPNTMTRGTTSHHLQNIHTVQRPYTRTKPTQMMQTR